MQRRRGRLLASFRHLDERRRAVLLDQEGKVRNLHPSAIPESCFRASSLIQQSAAKADVRS